MKLDLVLETYRVFEKFKDGVPEKTHKMGEWVQYQFNLK